MKAGRVFTTSSFTLPMASRSVPSASGLAGLLKPIWLSLIWRNVKAEASAARASLSSPKDFGTPPESVHKIPVPAQTMHSSAPLRLRPDRSSSASGASVGGLTSSNINVSFIRDGGSLGRRPDLEAIYSPEANLPHPADRKPRGAVATILGVAPPAAAVTHLSSLQENVMSDPTRPYEPLTSENAALILIDHKVGLMTGVRDYSTGELKHNVVASVPI